VSPGTVALIVVAVSIAVWAVFLAGVIFGKEGVARAAPGGRRQPSPGESSGEGVMAGIKKRLKPASLRGLRSAAKPPASEVDFKGERPAPETKVPEEERKPLTAEQLAMSRRQFFNRAWTLTSAIFLGIFGMASLSYLWPRLTGGFGTTLTIGDYNDLLSKIGPQSDYVPQFFPEGRFWLVYYDGTGADAVYLAINAKKYKMQALYRKCVHLGCSVPWCNKSYLFECPCHGSKYQLTGEYYSGPAPRGLDRFPIDVVKGKVMVDTGKIETGPPRGTATWPKFAQPKGPFCVPT
jgi:cytochrome b6-f complex iron-sulfur subunit